MTLPAWGSLLLSMIAVLSGAAASLGWVVERRRPEWMPAVRSLAWAACLLVVSAVCLLGYAFVTHDFRIRYVARYSDRSMPWWYLVTSLWGGQDGSLLWWSFLLSGYTGACLIWIKNQYHRFQPMVVATLMTILCFFAFLMLFSANPFSTSAASIPPDGEGLNPLLQNYWMMIHPPSLYMGFVGWSVPFAFVIAALVTGQLDETWLIASRRWVLVAWGFLSLGNLLGAVWSYEELGWGGYWAWDPVENAAFLPWLSGTAYLHSIMIQERRGMLKVWNVFLLCLTFFMTIFGTFLTRSGLIASVHSFARSDIGVYFIGFLVVLIVVCFLLTIWRLPLLKAEATMDALISREFAFLSNNWVLLGMQLFILLATTFPLLSEWVRGETVTVGPAYYNRWMVPLGLILLVLMGIGPLLAWKKSTQKNLRQAFAAPLLVAAVVGVLHLMFGNALGFPAIVSGEALYETWVGRALGAVYKAMPLCSGVGSAFVLATVGQEFWRGTRVRMKNAKSSGRAENALLALVRMTAKAKRRYGGYIVHVGIVLMFIGFTGAAYDQEQEAALKPGETMQVGGYTLRYDKSRMVVDSHKRMVFADLSLLQNGKSLTSLSPAKFIYRTHPDMPTTEVAIRSTPLNDVYAILNTVQAETKVGTFKVIVRPLVMWIWIGGVVLLLGTLIAVLPSLKELVAEKRRS